jgi:hypothetical protein
MPIRDPKLNWSKVIGSTAATQWKGLHDVSETVHSYNPMAGCKMYSTPFSVSGTESPKKADYPYGSPTARVLEVLML